MDEESGVIRDEVGGGFCLCVLQFACWESGG